MQLEIDMVINILFFLGILGVAVLVLLPFFFSSKKNKTIQPGVTREVMPPGYRRYSISIPQGYTGDKPAPLILALHYSGPRIAYYGEMFLKSMIEPAFQELEPIIISPDCPARDWTQPESGQLIFDLLDDVQEKFNIDPQRILVTGYSLGGMGTWHYAGRYPDRFTAAIVMAGHPLEDVLDIDWQIPLMVIHGRNDEVVSFQNTNQAVIKLEEKGVDITFRILEGVTHYETQYFVSALRNAIPWLEEKWGLAEM